MTLRNILPLIAATVSIGAIAAPAAQADTLSAPEPGPTQASVTCHQLFGSQYICRINHTFGPSDFHCDLVSKICRPI